MMREQHEHARIGMDKRKQSSLTAFFQHNSPASSTSNEAGPSKKSRVSNKGNRKLSVSSAAAWKDNALAQHSGQDWLIINSANGEDVDSLNCLVCRRFSKELSGIKSFSTTWAFSGSGNLKISNAKDHATGEAHKRAMELFRREQGLGVSERTELSQHLRGQGQASFLSSVSSMTERDKLLTKKKFEVAYFVAKEELPMKKYPKLLALEEMHGVELGTAYRNENNGATFVDFIGEAISKEHSDDVNKSNFYSVLIDGSTDSSVMEQEAVFILHFDPKPTGGGKVQIKLTFARLVQPETTTAEGIKKVIIDTFEAVGINDFEIKLIGKLTVVQK